jgi:hypothetical protein
MIAVDRWRKLGLGDRRVTEGLIEVDEDSKWMEGGSGWRPPWMNLRSE